MTKTKTAKKKKRKLKITNWRDDYKLLPDELLVTLKKIDLASGIFLRLVERIGQDDSYVAKQIEKICGISMTQDGLGNYFHSQGDSATLFCAHLDTVEIRDVLVDVGLWDISGTVVAASHNETILGADDRAGCALLCYMIIKGVPGNYAFFTEEESGRIGSENYSDQMLQKDEYDRAIQFDRAGYSDIITHQSFERTCSEDFAVALSGALNQHIGYPVGFKPDDGGTYTDTYSLRGKIPECTNISTGYDSAHSRDEWQDLDFLDALGKAAVRVEWEKLTTKRVPFKRDPYTMQYGFKYTGVNNGKASRYYEGSHYENHYKEWKEESDKEWEDWADKHEETHGSSEITDHLRVEEMHIYEVIKMLRRDWPDDLDTLIANYGEDLQWELRELLEEVTKF